MPPNMQRSKRWQVIIQSTAVLAWGILRPFKAPAWVAGGKPPGSGCRRARTHPQCSPGWRPGTPPAHTAAARWPWTAKNWNWIALEKGSVQSRAPMASSHPPTYLISRFSFRKTRKAFASPYCECLAWRVPHVQATASGGGDKCARQPLGSWVGWCGPAHEHANPWLRQQHGLNTSYAAMRLGRAGPPTSSMAAAYEPRRRKGCSMRRGLWEVVQNAGRARMCARGTTAVRDGWVNACHGCRLRSKLQRPTREV